MPRTAAALPAVWLAAGCLFLLAMLGWSGFLLVVRHLPALDPGWRVAAVLTALDMLVPRWLQAARGARHQQREDLRRVRALMATGHLPILPADDAPAAVAALADTGSTPLLPADLPLPLYEAAISTPACQQASTGEAAEGAMRTEAQMSEPLTIGGAGRVAAAWDSDDADHHGEERAGTRVAVAEDREDVVWETPAAVRSVVTMIEDGREASMPTMADPWLGPPAHEGYTGEALT